MPMTRSHSTKRAVILAAGALAMSCTLARSLDELSAGGPAPVDDGDADAAAESDSAVSKQDAAPRESKYRAAVLADQPVGYWRLGEKSGTVAKDEMGLHDGTYVGAVTFGITAKIFADGDTAITLDGKTGEVVIGDAFGFPGKTTFSIESWVSVPTLPDTLQFVAAKFDADAGSGWYVAHNLNFAGLGFGVMNNGLWSDWTIPITPNTWVHHVGTYSEQGLCVYINGSEVHCFEPGNTPAASAAPLVFGGLGSTAQFHLKGSLDEVAIYDHVLSAERVKAHYDARSAE